MANSIDSDLQRSAASDLGPHSFLRPVCPSTEGFSFRYNHVDLLYCVTCLCKY